MQLIGKNGEGMGQTKIYGGGCHGNESLITSSNASAYIFILCIWFMVWYSAVFMVWYSTVFMVWYSAVFMVRCSAVFMVWYSAVFMVWYSAVFMVE